MRRPLGLLFLFQRSLPLLKGAAFILQSKRGTLFWRGAVPHLPSWTPWHLGSSSNPSHSRQQKSFRLVLRKTVSGFYNIGSDKHALYKVMVFLQMCGVESVSRRIPICSVNVTNLLCLSALAKVLFPPWSLGHNRDSFPLWKEALPREKGKGIRFVTSELKLLYFSKSNHL